MSSITLFYVVATVQHAMEIPELSPINGNIVDFMLTVGGAVLVRIQPPSGTRRRIKWEIQSLTNGADLTRRCGGVPNAPAPGGTSLLSLGGYMPAPGGPVKPSPKKPSPKKRSR